MTASLLVGLTLAVVAAPPEGAGPGRLRLLAVEGKSGAPLDGVSVSWQALVGDKPLRGVVQTDKTGLAVIEWPAGTKLGFLTFTARKPAFAPVHMNWRGDARELSISAEKVLRFKPAVPIGGVVRDEAGAPVAGAKVTVSAPATESEQANYAFQLGSPTTDAAGRWRIDEAPADLAKIWARAEHPDYRQADIKPAHDLGAVTVMSRGLSVSGTVTDADGRPVKGAKAVVGSDIWGSPEKPNAFTDDRGAFTVQNCEAGPTIVTVQAEGFAPQFQDVALGGDGKPLAFRLDKGSTLRVRAVDVHGRPVAGAHFAADTWRGHRSIMYRKDADAQGLFEWAGAPPDVVLYDVIMKGYMTRRGVPLTAAEGVQTVTLYPLLVISGRVADAKEGMPLREFRVARGRLDQETGRVRWGEDGQATTFRDGQYKITSYLPNDSVVFRVEAPGFKAVESRALKPDEGAQSLDFRLERAEGSAGVVLKPDGRPAEGVRVALGTTHECVQLRSGRLPHDTTSQVATTGANGVFQFSPPDGPFLLVVAADVGFAQVPSAAFKQSGGIIDLQSWSKIEGSVRIGGKPGADQPVEYLIEKPQGVGGLPAVGHDYSTRTDDQGRFSFDRVEPGVGVAARVVFTLWRDGFMLRNYGWQEPVDVLPGATARLTLGGKGRPVIGRLVADGPPGTVDWPTNAWVSVVPKGLPPGAAGSGYFARVEKDGRFRIDDVSAGRYFLGVRFINRKVLRPDVDHAVDAVALPLEVADGPDAEVDDLGDLVFKVVKP